MTRTNTDIDEQACRTVMTRYGLSTKRDAVIFALRLIAAEPFDVADARALRGSGWDGNLEVMRRARA